MAKDKIKIYSKDVIHKETIKLDGWKYFQSSNCWQYNMDKYHLKYSLIQGNSNLGNLIIDFSISKLLNGNNALPSTQINANELIQKIRSDLEDIIDFNNVPDLSKWGIAKDETFIDIIASPKVIETINYIVEHSIIPRKSIDLSLKDEGSIYIYSDKDRAKASWQLIAYDKIKEGSKRGENIVAIKGLKEGQQCLRLELKTKRYSLKKYIKNYLDNDNDYSFPVVLTTGFQRYLILDVLNKLNLLNKKILTRDEMFEWINLSSSFKTKNQKENAIKSIRILNGERVRIQTGTKFKGKFDWKTINKYKKKLLYSGVNPIYVDHPIPEISQAMLDKAIYETGNLVIE